MNFNEELAMASALELTDSELEAAHGGWGQPEYEYVWTPYGWRLVPVEPNYYGGWGHDGWGWGHGDWDFRRHDRDFRRHDEDFRRR